LSAGRQRIEIRDPDSAFLISGVALSTAGIAMMLFGLARIPCSGNESSSGQNIGASSPCTAARYAPYLGAGAGALGGGLLLLSLRPKPIRIDRSAAAIRLSVGLHSSASVEF